MLEYISAPEAAKKWGVFRKTGTETLRKKPHTVVAKFSQLIIDININASQLKHSWQKNWALQTGPYPNGKQEKVCQTHRLC